VIGHSEPYSHLNPRTKESSGLFTEVFGVPEGTSFNAEDIPIVLIYNPIYRRFCGTGNYYNKVNARLKI
jgi:hypothetical protein